MKVNGISLQQNFEVKAPANKAFGTSFAQHLKEAVDNVNKLQINADIETQKLVAGEAENLHQVLIATEEAKIALELTVQVRNKIIEAYQEISRMQI
jgi:flagellar hook-basal body complex protein FliE